MPSQSRSRATVDAILQAATYILRKDGFAALTTNRIAAKAGVNIASLHQYFPNKHAIVAELHRRFMDDVHGRIEAVPPSSLDVPLARVVREGVRAALGTMAVDPPLMRAFFEELPARERTARPLDPAIADQWRRAFERKLVGVPDPALALWIWDEVLDALCLAACAKRPELLSSPLFAAELTTLLERYLVRSSADPHPSPRP